MKHKLVTIFGGTGFLGRYVVQELAKTGAIIQVACRTTDKAAFLKTAGHLGQIIPIKVDIRDHNQLSAVCKNSFAIIDLIGILAESSTQKFLDLHCLFPQALAKIARANNVEKMIFVSALGVEEAQNSKYAQSKLSGEKAILAEMPQATIIRPSLLIGPEDMILNSFATMAQFSPFIPLIGGGLTLFQPVHVRDVAFAVIKALQLNHCHGQTLELAGTKIYNFKQLLELLLSVIRKQRYFLNIPFTIAYIIAWIGRIMPWSPFTVDQVRLLQFNNIIYDKKNVLYFKDIGIKPTKIDAILTYLERYI